jgi:hypothetical protein
MHKYNSITIIALLLLTLPASMQAASFGNHELTALVGSPWSKDSSGIVWLFHAETSLLDVIAGESDEIIDIFVQGYHIDQFTTSTYFDYGMTYLYAGAYFDLWKSNIDIESRLGLTVKGGILSSSRERNTTPLSNFERLLGDDESSIQNEPAIWVGARVSLSDTEHFGLQTELNYGAARNRRGLLQELRLLLGIPITEHLAFIAEGQSFAILVRKKSPGFEPAELPSGQDSIFPDQEGAIWVTGLLGFSYRF